MKGGIKRPTGSSSWAEIQGAIVASWGGEIVEGSVGDRKLAFVPGRKPRDMSETIISVVEDGDGDGEAGRTDRGGGVLVQGESKETDCYYVIYFCLL